MHPFTAVSIVMATSPHLWKVVHAAPASTKSPSFPSVEEMESCQNTCLKKYPANDLGAQFNCNRECLHFPVSLLPPNPQSGLLNRGVTNGSPPGKFDYPACVQTCQGSEHGNATCTDACQRLLPCWMYCNHEYEQDDENHKNCLRTCVEDLKNTTSSALFDATPNTAGLNQVFSDTLLTARDTANACSEDMKGHVICADQPKMMVPRGDHDQCDMDCDEIQNAHQTYLCKMNCTDKYTLSEVPPHVYARHPDINTAEPSIVIRQEFDNDCTDYCNAHSSGGSASEIHVRCTNACATLDVCETACEAQGPNDGERCVVDCIMIGSDAKNASAVVARDSIPQAQAVAKKAIRPAKFPSDSDNWTVDECTDYYVKEKNLGDSKKGRELCKKTCKALKKCDDSCKGPKSPAELFDCLSECMDLETAPQLNSDNARSALVARSAITDAQPGAKEVTLTAKHVRRQGPFHDVDTCLKNCDGPTDQAHICRRSCYLMVDCHNDCKRDASPGQCYEDCTKILPRSVILPRAQAESKKRINTRSDHESNIAVGPLSKRYTPDQCKWACHEIDDPTNQICYQPCIEAGPGRSINDAADFVSLNIVPQIESKDSIVGTHHLDKRYTPEQCKFACHEIDDPTNQICYQPCIDGGPYGSISAAADFVSQEVIPKLHEKRTRAAATRLNKRYTPEQCKWACHEIDDPTNQICYQPCIDAHPGKQGFSIEAAAVPVLQDVQRRKMSDLPNNKGINISSPILTAEDLDRCTQGCIGYAVADSYPEPAEEPCSHVCMGVQACQSRCASTTDHETNINCGIDCFMTMCQSDSIDCRCVTSKDDESGDSSAECRLGLLNATEVRLTQDVHADAAENDGFDKIEGALRLREMSLVRRDDECCDESTTEITFEDLWIPSTTTTFADSPTMTSSEWVPLGTMEITVSAGSSLGCQSWQVVWVMLVAGVAGGMFLW